MVEKNRVEYSENRCEILYSDNRAVEYYLLSNIFVLFQLYKEKWNKSNCYC